VIFLPQYDLEIRTCPKVLSTSLKAMAYLLENGEEFKPFVVAGKERSVHWCYQTKPFDRQRSSRASIRVAFVRDPVRRFTSFYKNRVLHKRSSDVHQFERLANKQMIVTPTPDYLIRNLDEYRKLVPTIDHHAARQVEFLGRDLSYYDYVFAANSVPAFEAFMSELAGHQVRLPHQQVSGPKQGSMSWLTRRTVRRYYGEDFEVYGEALSSGVWARK